MFSINERLRLIDGKMDIESTPGRGTMITMLVPAGSGVAETGEAVTGCGAG